MKKSPRKERSSQKGELEKFLFDLVYAKYADADYAAKRAGSLIRGIRGERKVSDNPTVVPWGWSGTWAEFLAVSEREWLRSLLFHHQQRWSDLPLDSWQVWTWRVQFQAFRALLLELCERRPEVRDALVVFEYELPFEYGHRPDAILVLPSGHVIIVECKNREEFAPADRKQVMNYLDALASSAFLSWIDELAQKAKSNSEHKLVLITAAANSEVLGLKLILKQAEKGMGVLFFRGDSPNGAGLSHLVSAIDARSTS